MKVKLLIVIGIIIGLSYAVWHDLKHLPPTLKNYIQPAPVSNAELQDTLTVSLTSSRDYTAAAIPNGSAGLIAIAENHDNLGRSYKIITNFDELQQFDSRPNGRLDSFDNAFSQIKFVVIDPLTHTLQQRSLLESGIRVIFFDYAKLASYQENQAEGFDNTAGQVQLADGSRHPIRILQLPKGYIKSLEQELNKPSLLMQQQYQQVTQFKAAA